jgi:uncharacterized protein (DUF1778 family)
MPQAKDGQLQIRVSAAEKKAIRQAAARAGMDTSSFVRARLLPPAREAFQRLAVALAEQPEDRSFLLAEINDLLSPLGPAGLRDAIADPPPLLEPFLANYLAAMVETAAHRAGIAPPSWTSDVAPLTEPVFGTLLPGLRLHLLLRAPPAFRRRNIFIDASVGDRL